MELIGSKIRALEVKNQGVRGAATPLRCATSSSKRPCAARGGVPCCSAEEAMVKVARELDTGIEQVRQHFEQSLIDNQAPCVPSSKTCSTSTWITWPDGGRRRWRRSVSGLNGNSDRTSHFGASETLSHPSCMKRSATHD